MKLIVGLGNPGRKYDGTRHNVGFEVLDLLAGRHRLDWESAPAEALIAKWRAGIRAARQAADVHEPQRPGRRRAAAVLQDRRSRTCSSSWTMSNLELGRLRARPSGSAGGHNGLKSIIGALGTEEFARLRIGVGRGDARRDLADHVLAKFDPEERADVAEAVGRAADAAELFVTEGIAPVMNRFNRKEDGE